MKKFLFIIESICIAGVMLGICMIDSNCIAGAVTFFSFGIVLMICIKAEGGFYDGKENRPR